MAQGRNALVYRRLLHPAGVQQPYKFPRCGHRTCAGSVQNPVAAGRRGYSNAFAIGAVGRIWLARIGAGWGCQCSVLCSGAGNFVGCNRLN